jgi:hypothetical protein
MEQEDMLSNVVREEEAKAQRKAAKKAAKKK